MPTYKTQTKRGSSETMDLLSSEGLIKIELRKDPPPPERPVLIHDKSGGHFIF